tara:strand:+ start:8572 stop:9948 length:1377 start_codon:yes stop_codon:yes gene_type:complete
MAIIDVLKYSGPTNVLIWKWRPKDGGKREVELRLGTQLVVNESQEAIFYKGGKALDVFGPGTHTLSTKNLPLISKIIGTAFGGDSPFTAEVFYVNKATAMDTKWGLQPFNMVEPNFHVPIPVSARGSFAIKISDTMTFATQVVGTMPDLDAKNIQKYFKGIITENVKDAISKIAKEENISPVALETIVKPVSEAINSIVGQKLEKYGIAMDMFAIEAIPLIDDDPRVKQVIEDMRKIMVEDVAERKRLQRRAEHLEVYKTERIFDTTEKAADSVGSGGGGGGGSDIMGAMAGMGMGAALGGGMGKMMGDAMKDVSTNSTNEKNTTKCNFCNAVIPANVKFCNNCGKSSGESSVSNQNSEKVKCDKCNHEFPKTSKFCPECGDSYFACSKCGADNDINATKCKECGTGMPITCSKCSAQVDADAKFCSGCGNSMINSCSKCNAVLQPGIKFCSGCGTKQ